MSEPQNVKLEDINHLAIYPPIGIARIGNSPEYFLASEVPGVEPSPEGGYKDGEGQIKKQAVKFRIYAFNENKEVLGEISPSAFEVEWHVHVANIKAAWYEFNNALDLPGAGIPSEYRNKSVSDRSQLAIKPSPKDISGKNISGNGYSFDDGEFFGTKVNLGRIETDDEGRLIFVPGSGDAVSKDNLPPTTFANNEGWHDDTCDGVVRASVKVDGKTIEAQPAMVAVTPPNFGPGLFGVVTMNDVVQDLFIREMDYEDPAADGVDFYQHIYPILERMTNTQWVNEGFSMLFGHNSPSDFTDPAFLRLLESPSEHSKDVREKVLGWFRDPESEKYEPQQVPPFYGDGFGEYQELAIVDLPVTATQYGRLKKWAEGNFTTGKAVEPKTFEEMNPEEQINALNQAPLEECLGGPFHPGIELTWPMRVKSMWESPYRLKVVDKDEDTELDFGPLLSPQIALGANGPLSKSGPGALTRWLGVPWQTDEASCLSGYNPSTYLPLPSFWAARVPNQVLSEDGFVRILDAKVNIGQRLKHFDYRQDWLRDLGTQYLSKINKMVHRWHNLGIIARHDLRIADDTGLLPEVAWVESGRPLPKRDPSFEQVEYAEETILEARRKAGNEAEDETTLKLRSAAKSASPDLAEKSATQVKEHAQKVKLNRTASHTTYDRDEM